MFLILYHCLVSVALFLCFPFFLCENKERLWERLGLVPTGKIPFNEPIWVHALSVGEVLSAIPLVKALKEKYPQRGIVLSATTKQGMRIAREKLQGDVASFIPMPVDFWWSMHRMVRRIHPCLFVLVETDIWPGLLFYLRKKGIICLLVNGRISPQTYVSYKRIPFLSRKMFQPFEKCLMQSDLDRDRLVGIGVEEKRVKTSGNIKFDHGWTQMNDDERSRWMRELHIGPDDIVFLAGSTHPGEEEMLLRVYRWLCARFSHTRMFLAPRRIERADEIFRFAHDAGFKVSLKTQVENNPKGYDVLIIDTIGELSHLYGLAQVSFVGGSLVPFGGHNLLEPASFGCPVLFGAHTENFVQMSEGLLQSGGGWRIKDEKELQQAMLRLLDDPLLREDMGGHAREFVLENRGALERVMAETDQLLIGERGKTAWK